MARDVVGIDLGTTNTVVYRFRFYPGVDIDDHDAPFPVPICYPDYLSFPERNSNSLPSVLYLKEDGQGGYQPFTGDIAQQLMASNPNQHDNLLFNTKRLMGNEERPLAGGYTAQRVAEEFYKVCFHSVRKHQPKRIPQQVCVTRPAAFDPFGINSTIAAAANAMQEHFPEKTPELAALEEPQAALLSFLYNKLKLEDGEETLLRRQAENGGILTFAVVDIGGGTTDVTVQPLKISGSRGQDAGDTYLTGYTITFINRSQADGRHAEANPNVAFGGLNFDEAAAGYLMDRLDEKLREQGLALRELSKNDRDALRKLATMRAKEFKEMEFGKSSQLVASWIPPLESFNIQQSVEVTFTHQEYETWVEPLCGGRNRYTRDEYRNKRDSIYSLVEKTLSNSGYQAGELDCLYVTGGMSYYPGVENMLRREYGEQTEVAFAAQPLRDIARGAALYNSYFKVNRDQVLLNSCIMVDRPSGEAIVLAQKGEPLPQKDRADGLRITNPVEMTVDILRGASAVSPDLTRIKTLRCRLPSGRMTEIDTPVDISYEVTEEQRITLTLHIQDKRGPYDMTLRTDNSGAPENDGILTCWREADNFSDSELDAVFTDPEQRQRYFLYKDLEEKWVLFFKHQFGDLRREQASAAIYERRLSEKLWQWRKNMGQDISPLEPFLFALKLYDGILTDELGDVREEYLDAIARALLPCWNPNMERDNKFIQHILLCWNWFSARAVVIRMYKLMPYFTDPVLEQALRNRLHSVRDAGLVFDCLLSHDNSENLNALLQFMIESVTPSSRSGPAGYVTDSMKSKFREYCRGLSDAKREELVEIYEELHPQHQGRIRYLENMVYEKVRDPKYYKLEKLFSRYNQASSEEKTFLRREWDPANWDHQQLCRYINSKHLLEEIIARLEQGSLSEVHRVGVLYWIAQSSFAPAREYILQKQQELDKRWKESGQYPYQWMEYSLASNRISQSPDWQDIARAFFSEGQGYLCAREIRRRTGGKGPGPVLKEAVTELGMALVIPPADEKQALQVRRFFSGVKELYTRPYCITQFPPELDQVVAKALEYAPENDTVLLDILLDVLDNLAARETRGRFYNMLLDLHNRLQFSMGLQKRVRDMCDMLYAEGR